jgi:predicted dehydrogenase
VCKQVSIRFILPTDSLMRGHAMKSNKIAMLGTGFISMFYTETLHGLRSRDRVHVVYSRNKEKAGSFADKYGIPKWSDNLEAAVSDPEINVVVVGIPNNLHKDAVLLAAEAGKSILCTKPLGRNGTEALEMLRAVEKAGVFAGYLEDLVYTPKTLKALNSVKNGALGKILWVRSRETHPGPHSDWFFDIEQAGGGAIIDMGCHTVEIIRNFIGKDIRPMEVMCTADTLVHPIEAEDSGIGLIRFQNRAIGQFEVNWTFRGGMDLRDEISGTEGTIWLNHWLRTGMDMFTAVGEGGYVAEKAETDKGWLFPVGDEEGALGYVEMFRDMLDALDSGSQPMETFYDGYVVNAVIDACYRSAKSKQWEPVNLEVWRGSEEVEDLARETVIDNKYILIKQETMPDGQVKQILKDRESGKIIQRVD